MRKGYPNQYRPRECGHEPQWQNEEGWTQVGPKRRSPERHRLSPAPHEFPTLTVKTRTRTQIITRLTGHRAKSRHLPPDLEHILGKEAMSLLRAGRRPTPSPTKASAPLPPARTVRM